tara:strand:- start:312 stop:1760 length:1449 start_codon:yes stop_codon:yes gene_type:complete
MLSSIRKFSSSIYAKILLGIVAIPFIFWGMGTSFSGGSKNIILEIENDKYSIQEFSEFIKRIAPENQKISSTQIEEILSLFISDKLIEKEVENLGIKFSDNSLAKLIKNEKDFKRGNVFSRTEYEKFLLENNISASIFENNLLRLEKKKQLLSFIGGGIVPSKFLVNKSYNKINQKRNVQLIDLNKIFNNELNFSESEIKSYFEINKKKYEEIYKSIRLLELTPKKLLGDEEFTDLYFKKIDEIDDRITQGKNLNYILEEFNLEKANTFTVNELGKNINDNIVDEIPINLIENIFSLNTDDSILLIETDNKYFIVEHIETKNIQKNLKNPIIKKSILTNLKKDTIKKLISEIISKINQNSFTKSDFDKLSKEKNLTVKKINIESQNDDKILNKNLINQIYSFSEKKVIVVHDVDFVENFLIYIDEIENVDITENSDDYKKYFALTKVQIRNELFDTYDNYIRSKYEIDVNYKALDTVKNYFN